MKNLDNENVLTFSFCFLIYGNYYRLTKTYKSISGQPNQILAGPIGQPRKKLSLTPDYVTVFSNSDQTKQNFKNDFESKNIYDILNKEPNANPNEN